LVFFCFLGFFVISSLILLLKFIITRDRQPFHSKSDLTSSITPALEYPHSTPSPLFLTEQRCKMSPTCPHHPGSSHICIVCHHPTRYFTSRPGTAPRQSPAWVTSQSRAQGLVFGTTAQLRAAHPDCPCCDDDEGTQFWACITRDRKTRSLQAPQTGMVHSASPGTCVYSFTDINSLAKSKIRVSLKKIPAPGLCL